MGRFLAQVLIYLCLLTNAVAEPSSDSEVDSISFESLVIKESIFGDFSMLSKERDDYATNITQLALIDAKANPADEKTMESVRRFLALSLHLSPRNRLSVVANHQLGKGIMPDSKDPEYSRSVFARLLLTRGELLKQQADEADNVVGYFFISLAAVLDPKNEDAVYASEIQKIEGKEPQWSFLLADQEPLTEELDAGSN